MNLQQIHAQLHHRPMNGLQMMIVALCMVINMLDGLDILAASLVSPILTRLWELSPEMQGSLLAAGPLGMAAGALVLSPVADIFGRRTSIMMCLTLMTIGMLLSATANSVGMLTALRFVTGLGVGAMASSTGTMVFEFSSLKHRALGLGLVVVGYPLGATLGGIASQGLIAAYDWRALFVVAGVGSALLIPIVFFAMPESLDYLVARQPRNALQRLNHVLQRLQLAALGTMPSAPVAGRGKGSLLDLLRQPVLPRTLIMAASYLLYMTSSYFALTWANQMTTDAGFSDIAGRQITNMINTGGIIGAIVIGLACFRAPFKPIAFATLVVMGLAIVAFGIYGTSLTLVGVCSVLIGFGIFGGAVVLYQAAATTFPARVRATGIGLSMSAGRIGSAIGPQAAGLLFGAGLGRIEVCVLLAIPVVLSAFTLINVPQTSLDDAAPSA